MTRLREIAYSRSGDKGDICNVCVFPYDDADFDRLREALTVDVVREKYGSLVKGDIVRYEMPGTCGLNFVMYGALDGGVSISLRVDPHGKSMQNLILDIDV